MTSTDARPARPAGESIGPWQTFTIAACAVFLVALDTSVVVAAYSALRAEFTDASATWLSWTLNAYTIVFAALLVPAGRWADIHGRKRTFMQGLCVFTVGSALCAASSNIELLVGARAVQAVGAAMMMPASLALLLQAFAREQRAAAVGMYAAVGALATAIGPAIGSWIIAYGSWRWVFMINLPVGVLGLWAARRLVESSSDEHGVRVDWFGIILLVVGAGLLTLGIVRTEALGWASQIVWAIIVSGLGVLVGFVFWARARTHPALDLSLFDDVSYRVVNVATVFFSAAMSLMFLHAFLMLMEVWQYPQSVAGLAITPGPLIVLPIAILSGRLAGRFGHRPLLVGGGLLFAAVQIVFYARLESTPDFLGLWLPGQLALGTSIGMVMPSLSGAAVAKLGPQRYAAGGSVNNAVRQLGSAIGASLAVALVGGHTVGFADFRLGYLILAALSLSAAVLSVPVRTHPRDLAAP
ncbi:MAG: MFS transporter [Burkholderiaceae bacterium]